MPPGKNWTVGVLVAEISLLAHFFGSWNISRNIIFEIRTFSTEALFLRNYFNFILGALPIEILSY